MTYSSEWFPIAPILEGACDVLRLYRELRAIHSYGRGFEWRISTASAVMHTVQETL